MQHLKNLAIIGSGPTAIYLLKNILIHIETLKHHIKSVTIFEKEKVSGMGMPYHPKTTDIYNLANISSEEIPLLQDSFADWLNGQSRETLEELNITQDSITETDVYSRVALGHYFQAQFNALLELIRSHGIIVTQHCESEVLDILPVKNNQLIIKDQKEHNEMFSVIVIATGHGFKESDRPKQGYFASPWPIHKILPKKNEHYNFPIGTLGASLSAFDVVTSLSHRHGQFIKTGNRLKFILSKDAPNFKIVLHSAEGWLPHLQYEQQEPIRGIYRHFNREQLLELIDSDGFLHLETYFDELCRQALILAFKKDHMESVVKELELKTFSFKDFVEAMSERHEYTNSFEGMKLEMIKARNSVENNIPIHWMETLDDLMYSLNYHAELLPAEDHEYFHKNVMAFLMNVIAALPLESADILLALYDAECIELIEGFVTIKEGDPNDTSTKVNLKENKDTEKQLQYNLFVNCGGQKKMELDDFPFPSLVEHGIVRTATAKYASFEASQHHTSEAKKQNNSKKELTLSGIDIDATYRTIKKDGKPNDNLYDINFTHTNGLRPYSYGLQACNATSRILVESWVNKTSATQNQQENILEITKIYEDTEEL